MNQAVTDDNFLTFITGGHCRFWSINPYHLCDIRCTYCITGVQGASRPVLPSVTQSLSRLARALGDIPADQPLIVGGISDAYPGTERELGLSRKILELLIREGRTFCIITKSVIVERDLDLIENYSKARVEFSFSTLDDRIAASYELDAPPPSVRLQLLKRFAAAGVPVKVSLRPWIPGISNLLEFLADVPAGIPIGLERLKIMRASQTIVLAGRTFTQQYVDASYLAERERYRGCKRLKWSFDRRFSSAEQGPGQHPVDLILSDNRQAVVRLRQLQEREMDGRGQTP
ncbi:MAG: hypothetical protein Hals2KO_28690 [Halioglobus sp.]